MEENVYILQLQISALIPFNLINRTISSSQAFHYCTCKYVFVYSFHSNAIYLYGFHNGKYRFNLDQTFKTKEYLDRWTFKIDSNHKKIDHNRKYNSKHINIFKTLFLLSGLYVLV